MTTRWLTPLALVLVAVGAHAQTSISELRVDQTGADNDEYFELVGTPNDSLNDLTYLVLGDGTGGSGVIESVTSLAGQVLDANGFFVCAETSFTLGTANLVVGSSGLNFENSDTVTHLLVSGFTGANGDDLDTNDDGTLDVLPWTSVLDSVALTGTTNTEFPYSSNVVGPDGSFVPGHVYFCTVGGWQIGPFDAAGGVDTPGAANPCGSSGPVTFCNDGDGATANCPCGNVGVAGAGCDNAGATGGSTLSIGDFQPDGNGAGSAVLVADGFPPAAFPTVVLMRSSAQMAPLAFGDGLLCLQPPVVRIGSTTAVSGNAGFTLNHGAGAGTFRYQAWYRSTPASFCSPEAFNLSSGVELDW